MRRISLGVAVVALLVVATVIVMRRVGGGESIEFRWVALGDSYSSGLGEIDRRLECARDVNASYAGRAAGLLRSRGYGVTLQLHACSSARLDHVFVP